MSTNTIRSAIGAALDHPFTEEAFALVDLIEANVRSEPPIPESTRHEVASEVTDTLLDVISTRGKAILWADLSADGAYQEAYGEPTGGSTLDAVTSDLFVVVERAVFAAQTVRTTEVVDRYRPLGS